MSDHDGEEGPRPRPQYGEYATPEEQRAAIKQPAEWQLEDEQTDAAQPPAMPGAYQPGRGPVPGARVPDHEDRRPYGPAPAQRLNLWDRVATVVLLGLGLFNVVDMIVNAAQGGALVRESAQSLSAGEEELLAAMPGWLWPAMAIAYAIVWLIALSTSLRAMRAGRIAFWIPIVAGIIAGLVVVALLAIAVGENPQLLNDVPTSGGPGAPT